VEKEAQHPNVAPGHTFMIKVNGRKLEFSAQVVTAREILNKAGFEGEFCLAATHGESGKVTQKLADNERVDLHEHKHFRATFCGSEVVS